MITTEGARQLCQMNLVGSTADEKDDHILACHEAIHSLKEETMITIEGARQLCRMNLVGSTADEKDDHILACHEAIHRLSLRLDKEII
jgi:hypothetical protein